ncbi:MAG TPA: nitroreductase family protein, partial [Armatimonadaceae bacterium]|nr:nitroreductase family protein [Armatimonadaceae bacterium]
MPAFNEQDIETLRRAIAHRRSMGLARLKPDPVEPRLIETLLEAANWAPSHGDTEPWRFTVFTGESRRALGDVFAEAYRLDAEADGDGFKQNTYEAYRERGLSAPVWISVGVQPALR